jgi:hypothetical protein
MTAFSESLRARAKQLREAANTLLGAEDYATNHEKQCAAIVGQVTANVQESLADLADYLRSTDAVDLATQRRRAILEKNDAIRRAAASSNWAEFDRLTGFESSGSSGDGQGGTSEPTGE